MEEWYECVLADFDGPVRSCEELPCLRAVMLCIPDAEAVQWYGGKKYSILFLYLFKFEIILTFKKKKEKKLHVLNACQTGKFQQFNLFF